MKIDNFFAELKRRNVVRIAGLYLVGAWLLVQVAGTVLPMFGAPDWLPRSIVILLAIGFFPAMIFSWVFELTPSGLKRDEEVKPEESIAPQTARRMNQLIIAVLLLALGYFVFDKIVLAPRREASLVAAAEKSLAARSAESNANSIAVLPFADMSQEKDQEYFAHGISEELLNALVRVQGIRVASRTSSFAYKESELGSAAIAAALKVGYLVEGSVRKSGDRVRITAQLIDAINDKHLFSETYDRKLADIFAVQGEIANAVVTALRGTLGTDSQIGSAKVRADTDNLEAYDLYLKARELFIARENLKESIRLSERAVELDPKFARGWEGLAAVYAIAKPWGIRDRDYLQLSNQAAKRSLELDPSLSMPWAVLGNNLQLAPPINWEQGFEFFNKATAADPKNATAYLWRGIGWMNLGFFDRSIADIDSALAIDPAYRNCVRWKAQALLYKGQLKPALKLFEKGLAEGFVVNRAHSFIGPLLQRGDRISATLLMDHLVKKPALREILINALEKPAAPPPDLESILKQCETEPELITHMGKTGIYLWLGAYDQVATAEDNDAELAIAWERFPASFRNSAGFKRTLERLGVVAYWRKHGFPPQCRASGNADFECK